VNDTKIEGRTRLKINDVIGFGCMINETTRNDKTYYVFSLQKRENVTVLDDGVICLDDDDDDDYDNNRNVVQPVKIESTTSNHWPEQNSSAIPNDITPHSSKSKWLFENDGFKFPEPVEVYVPDETVLESQSLIHLSLKREEEELFDESHSFNEDSDEEDYQPLTQIDIDVSDEEDCLILGSFSQQLNIDGVYRRAIKAEIKDEVLSDNENIDDFFEEIDMPVVENVPDQIPEPPTTPQIPFTQDIESRLASIMPEDGSVGVMEYEEEMCTENLAALLDDTLPEQTTPVSPHLQLITPPRTLPTTATKSTPAEPIVNQQHSKDDSHRIKREIVERRKSTGEEVAEDGLLCTPLRACVTQLEARMSVKRPAELNDAQPMPKRIVRRRHSTTEMTYPLHISPSPPILETPSPPQPTCQTTPPQLTPLRLPNNQESNKRTILSRRNSTALVAVEEELLCTPLTACVTQLKAKMSVKKPPELIDAQPMPKRRGRSKSTYFFYLTILFELNFF
jgi:hypothetical protein